MTDFSELENFIRSSSPESKVRGLSAGSEIVETDQFDVNREPEILDIVYGENKETNQYIIPGNSILDPSHFLPDFVVERIPVDDSEEAIIKRQIEKERSKQKTGKTFTELKQEQKEKERILGIEDKTEEEFKKEKEKEELEKKTGIKVKPKLVVRPITYHSIDHYVYTKLLCSPQDQIGMRYKKSIGEIKSYFESKFNNCLVNYQIKEREEYEDVKGSVSLRKNIVDQYGNVKVIDVGVLNYVLEQYKIAITFALDIVRRNYKEFVKELLNTGDQDIIYRNTLGLQYTDTNKGFVFEFNRRLDKSNIYGKALQDLREKIRFNIAYYEELSEREKLYVPYLNNEKIKKYLETQIKMVIYTFKYFFDYLTSIAFPQTGKYSEIKTKTIENLELRQHKTSNFYLTPEMLNYVIKEIMLSNISMDTTFKYKDYDIFITNMLEKQFPILKKEKNEKKVGKTTKAILIDKIWGYIFNKFLSLKTDDIKSTIKNIKNFETELKEKQCDSESKRVGKEGCVVEALTYILITIMDWNEFTEITRSEIDFTCLILSDNFFRDKDNQKVLTKKLKNNDEPNQHTLKVLSKQLNKYNLEISENLLNYLGNIIDYIMSKDEDPIWSKVMFYAHKF